MTASNPGSVGVCRLVFASCVTAVLSSCAAPPQRPVDAEIVPCPLNDVANHVLRNVVENCASRSGDWSNDMGPGCPRVWAVQFGYTAGRRRGRADLQELAEATADRQSAEFNDLLLGAVFGRETEEGPETYGIPALFLSGVLAASGTHYAKFRLALDRALEEMDLESLPDTHLTGSTVLLAEVARTEGQEGEPLLEKARALAGAIGNPKFRAFALSTIAKSSGREEDIQAARGAVEAATPAFRPGEGKLVFDVEDEYVLSSYLALIQALADLAQLTGNPFDRSRAEALLDFVFSDHLFDGHVLAHDGRRDGFRSIEYCSGCNLQALYLVDRLYGDTFKIDPLPPLSDRPTPRFRHQKQAHRLFAVRSGQPGSAFLENAALTVGYTELPPSSERPHGALEVSYELTDSIQACTFSRKGPTSVIVALDESGGARFDIGADSLVEGDYDPQLSSFTLEIRPPRGDVRDIVLIETRQREL